MFSDLAQDQNNVLYVNVGSLKTYSNQLNRIILKTKSNQVTVTILDQKAAALWIQTADAAVCAERMNF